MTALALPAPRLLRADILKFRRRRGLAVVVGVLTIVAITLTYAIIELFHVANAAKYGAAGGLDNLANGTNLVATLGAAAAAIVGGVAAVGGRDAGVYRDLVVTGRSRVALLLSRMLGGLAYLLPFVAGAFAIACVASVALRGNLAAPSLHVMVAGGLWTLLSVTFYYLVSFGVACLTGSRSYTIGIVLAFRLALTPLLASISALGIVRELVPGVAIDALMPGGLGNAAQQGPRIGMSVGRHRVTGSRDDHQRGRYHPPRGLRRHNRLTVVTSEFSSCGAFLTPQVSSVSLFEFRE